MRNFCQYIFLLVFVFTFNLQGYSQTLFNIKGGVGLQNQANSDGDFKLAFNAGISYEYKFSDFLWIDLGVDYTQKGTDLGVFQNVTQFTTRINYIEIPVYVKYRYLLTEDVNWAFYAGPSIGYALNASNRFFRIAQPVILDIPIGGDAGITQIEPAINVGAEINFGVEYGYMGLYTNFQYGLNTAFTGINGIAVRNYGITAGLKIQIGDKLEVKNPYDREDY